MMNLECRPGGVVLACSECGVDWPVHEGQPFVAQLRLVALGHRCPADADRAVSSKTARRSHLHLVSDG